MLTPSHTPKRNRLHYHLCIFLPTGRTWLIAEHHIKTERTATGTTIMHARRFDGHWSTWLAAARNICKRPEWLVATITGGGQ